MENSLILITPQRQHEVIIYMIYVVQIIYMFNAKIMFCRICIFQDINACFQNTCIVLRLVMMKETSQVPGLQAELSMAVSALLFTCLCEIYTIFHLRFLNPG